MNSIPRLLICDDDQLFHLAIKQALKNKYECRSAFSGDEALAIVSKQSIDVLLLDVQMRTPDEGLKYLPRLKEADPSLAIVMSSGLTDFGTVREAMRLGASDYVPKDFEPNDLEHTLGVVLEKRELIRRGAQQNFEVASGQKKHVLIGNSPAIQQLHKLISKVRASSANVVITGETGTGKEVVARQLRGVRPDGALVPFVPIDSSTIQSSTAESTLFGHEKGAFTGAETLKKGIFEEANGGIVYFDEIGNMPLEIQAKLLRVLQEKTVMRLGSVRPLELDFRLICATNRDLEKMATSGHFKDDLFQRLNVIPISLPPLRERVEDVPELLEHFVRLSGAREGALRFSPEAVSILQSYDWPGNIRELANLVAYLQVMVEGDEIEISDLPPKLRDRAAARARDACAGPEAAGGFYERVEAFEASILRQAYESVSGNVSKLALQLGMDRSHLYSKLKQYRIHPKL